MQYNHNAEDAVIHKEGGCQHFQEK